MAEVQLEDAPQSIRTYYDKGVAAMERSNLDYAMDMFEAALCAEPGLLIIRKLLRIAAIKKAKKHPPGKFAAIKGIGVFMKASSLLKKKPQQAMELAEKLVRTDPFDLKFSKLLCDAAEAAGFPEAAILTLEILKENSAPVLAVLEPLARLYAEAERFEQEYECRTAIARLKPTDSIAQKELKDAAARLTMGKAGWQKAESFRDVLRPDEPQVPHVNALEQLQLEVDTDPQNSSKRKLLAEAQLQNKLYPEAIHNFEICLKQGGSSDPQLEKKLFLAREHQLNFELAKAEDANDRDQVYSIRQKLVSMRIENAARQVERYPNDLQLKFDYGKLLLDAECYNEAIQQLQQAQRNPQRRIRSLIYLAQAFKQKGQSSIAREQLETALAELSIMDESKKEVLYEIGLLCETADEASRFFKEIYSVDIGYRDVAAKIDNA